jgi:hypothetical protein
MSQAIDLTGKTFGWPTVIERAPPEHRAAHWLCRCNCSPTARVVVRSDSLVQGRTKSCGCGERGASSRTIAARTERTGRELKAGDMHGSLLVKAYVAEGVKGELWRLDCACGKHKMLPSADVLSGRVTDCGTCEIAEERISNAHLAVLIARTTETTAPGMS